MEYFKADWMLAAIRIELKRFIRSFGVVSLSALRSYPGLHTPVALVTIDYRVAREQVHRRYPFFQSDGTEQKILFERRSAVSEVS